MEAKQKEKLEQRAKENEAKLYRPNKLGSETFQPKDIEVSRL